MPHSSSPAARARAAARRPAREATSRRNAPSARPSSTGRPGESPFQNGISPDLARRRRDQHPVVGDVLDAPRRRAEQEHVADPRLVDHLLVELADPPARALTGGEEDAEQAAVGDGAAAGDGQPLRAAPRGQLAGDAVPHQARPQLGERVGRVAAGQHVEHGLERRARQPGERRGAADELLDLVDGRSARARPWRRSAGRARRAGCAGSASTRSRRRACARRRRRIRRRSPRNFGKITPRLTRRRPGARPGRPAAARRPPTAATRPGRRDRPRPCRCRVRGCDVATTAGSRPALRSSSTSARCSRDTDPWWARATTTSPAGWPAPDWAISSRRRRAVVEPVDAGALGGQLVEPGGEPLGEPAGVGEHDRRAVRLDEVEDALLDVRPDARPPAGAGGRAGEVVGGLAEAGHVLDRHDDLELEGLVDRRLHDGDRPAAGEEGGDLVDRPHGGREADALGRPVEQRVEPLEGQGQVRAALGGADRVHLVDDHRVDTAQRLARRRGEQQEQRLGRGDQDVGRRAGERRRSSAGVSPERMATVTSGAG